MFKAGTILIEVQVQITPVLTEVKCSQSCVVRQLLSRFRVKSCFCSTLPSSSSLACVQKMIKAALPLALTLLSICMAAVAVQGQYGAYGTYGEPGPALIESCGDLDQACCGPEEREALGTDIPCPVTPGISCCDDVCITGTFCASDDESDEGDDEQELAGFETCGSLGELCCNPEQRDFFESEVPCFKTAGISCCDGVCIEGTFCASDEE